MCVCVCVCADTHPLPPTSLAGLNAYVALLSFGDEDGSKGFKKLTIIGRISRAYKKVIKTLADAPTKKIEGCRKYFH